MNHKIILFMYGSKWREKKNTPATDVFSSALSLGWNNTLNIVFLLWEITAAQSDRVRFSEPPIPNKFPFFVYYGYACIVYAAYTCMHKSAVYICMNEGAV